MGPRPARILYVESNHDHTVGGSHRILLDLVTRLDRSRYEPVVLFYQDNVYVERLRQAGVATLVWDVPEREYDLRRRHGFVIKRIDDVRAIFRRAALLRELEIDLLHLNNSVAIGNEDWLPAAWLRAIPCLVTAMGDASPRLHPLRRRLALRFDRVVCISQYLYDSLHAWGFPEDRLLLAQAGIDGEAFRARVTRSREAVRAELGVTGSRLLVTMVGNIRSWKGQHLLLEALARLDAADRERVRVVFAGATAPADEPYQRELEAMLDAHALRDTATLLGSREDVPSILAASDIAVHASTGPEPFGLVVVEAMAVGTPIVASECGGPAEILTPDTGLRFDPAEPARLAEILSDLIRDPERRNAMGEAGRARADLFSADAFAEKVQRMYDELRLRGRAGAAT